MDISHNILEDTGTPIHGRKQLQFLVSKGHKILEIVTVCCGHRPQHPRNHKNPYSRPEADTVPYARFCDRRLPQFVVAVDHNILKGTGTPIHHLRPPQFIVPEGQQILEVISV